MRVGYRIKSTPGWDRLTNLCCLLKGVWETREEPRKVFNLCTAVVNIMRSLANSISIPPRTTSSASVVLVNLKIIIIKILDVNLQLYQQIYLDDKTSDFRQQGYFPFHPLVTKSLTSMGLICLKPPSVPLPYNTLPFQNLYPLGYQVYENFQNNS